VAALATGARWAPRPEVGGWYLLAGAQVLNAAGLVAFHLYPIAASVRLPVPSLADGLFLGSYAASVAAVGLLARRHGAGRTALLDSAILTAAGAVVLWVVLLQADADAPGPGLSGRLVTMAYPVMDLLLLATAAPLALAAGRSPRGGAAGRVGGAATDR
jgi:hypothetical protein